MEMTGKEIAARYSSNPTEKEVKILAELNLCTRYDIARVLIDQGVLAYDCALLQRSIDWINEDNKRIKEQTEGIEKIKQTSPTRCQPGQSVDVWKEAKVEADGKEENKQDDTDGKADSRVEKDKEAAGEDRPERVTRDMLPEIVVDALISKLDKLETEMHEIDKRRKMLNEEYAQKEEDYKVVCRYMGVGAW